MVEITVRTFGGIEFVAVPKGKFLMGSRNDNKLASDNEKPQHAVEIPYDYWIGRYPITYQQYAEFVERSAYIYGISSIWKERIDHPVVDITRMDAEAFCHWLIRTHSAELPEDCIFRLPSEAEWEKAARGEFGNEWPWGNEFDPNKCNSAEGGKDGTTPVSAYSPAGDSPYGAANMAGNVWEFTQSLDMDYPYNASDGREIQDIHGDRMLRGGQFGLSYVEERCANRLPSAAHNIGNSIGFRVVVAPVIKSET